MQIDWFTVLAQLVNFLVLVWLLKRYLYQRILDAIDAREMRIAATLKEAADTQAKADSECERYKKAVEDLEAQRSQLMIAAKESANQEHRRLLAEAQAAAAELHSKLEKEQARQLQKLRESIQMLTVDEVFALTRKLLSELANTSLEQSMIVMFAEKLRQMPKPSGTALLKALNDEQRQLLQCHIDTWANAAVPLQFETKDSLVCGIELEAKGQQIAWHIAMNLELLDAALAARIVPETAGTAAEPASVS